MIRFFVQAASIILLGHADVTRAEDWTMPVEVRFEFSRCISYRAKLSGSYLVVEATPDPGWHTFAMDNDRRAAEKLAGRKSLGVEQPTKVKVSGGLEVAGSWHQTPPKDASQPEMNWFTWVFEGRALFMAPVRRTAGKEARIGIRGQACTESSCINVDVEISLPLADARPSSPDVELTSLVPVRD